MKRDREENDHKTLQSRRSHGRITADEIDIPLDLTVEILKKIPTKSLVRFQCVSKQWSTIIGTRKDFIDSIVTRSLAQPQHDDLHFIFHHYGYGIYPFFFFSSTYLHKEHAVLIPGALVSDGILDYQYVRGLICYPSYNLARIYNPTTRKSVSLPANHIESPLTDICFFFGHDPVMNQYKVMSVTNWFEKMDDVCQVFTLGDPTKQWRNIKGIENHDQVTKGVHINGTIYYGATPLIRPKKFRTQSRKVMFLMSFDFTSERFVRINVPNVVTNGSMHPTVVNYKGKFGCFCYNSNGTELWVMENAEKQEWSKITLCFSNNPQFRWYKYYPGVTLGGKIFIIQWVNDLLSVYYYNSKLKYFKRTVIESTRPPRTTIIAIVAVSGHVENTMCL